MGWCGLGVIVPKESIAGIELRMTRAEVKEKKGQPDRIVHGSNDLGTVHGVHLQERGGQVKVKATFQVNPNVTWISTNRKTQKTAEGIHVGSPESALHAAYPRLHCATIGEVFRHCWTGHMSGPKIWQGDQLPHRYRDSEGQAASP